MSLKIKNLSYSYGKNIILKEINMKFLPGQIYVIAGPNGSGKTTLVKAIMSLIKIKSECVFLNEIDILNYSILDRSKNLGYVAQNFNSDFNYTVYEIVEMGRYSFKNNWDPAADKKAILKALKLTETLKFKDRPINSLSGGELQRVLLARAISGEPKHLILDEPSSFLDISHNISMMKLIKKLTIDLNMTTIIVLHDLNSMIRYCNEVILIKDGVLKYNGSVEKTLTPPIIKEIFNIESELIVDSNGLKHILIV